MVTLHDADAYGVKAPESFAFRHDREILAMGGGPVQILDSIQCTRCLGSPPSSFVVKIGSKGRGLLQPWPPQLSCPRGMRSSRHWKTGITGGSDTCSLRYVPRSTECFGGIPMTRPLC